MSWKSGPQFPSTLYRYNDEVNSINHLNDLWRSFYQSVQLTEDQLGRSSRLFRGGGGMSGI